MSKKFSFKILIAAILLYFFGIHSAIAQQIEEPKHWEDYSSVEYGITVSYPSSWKLFTNENPGQLEAMWDNNQLIVCVHPHNSDINFNIRLARGTPPKPFAEKIKAMFMDVSRQMGSRVISFRPLFVAGSNSAELVQIFKSGDDFLQQRMVVVSRPKIGFFWTFTSPKESYDILNKELFEQLLNRAVFTKPKNN